MFTAANIDLLSGNEVVRENIDWEHSLPDISSGTGAGGTSWCCIVGVFAGVRLLNISCDITLTVL